MQINVVFHQIVRQTLLAMVLVQFYRQIGWLIIDFLTDIVVS